MYCILTVDYSHLFFPLLLFSTKLNYTLYSALYTAEHRPCAADCENREIPVKLSSRQRCALGYGAKLSWVISPVDLGLLICRPLIGTMICIMAFDPQNPGPGRTRNHGATLA